MLGNTLGNTYDQSNDRSMHKSSLSRLWMLCLFAVTCGATPDLSVAKKLSDTTPPTTDRDVTVIEKIDLDSPVHTQLGEFGRYSYTLKELGALGPIELRTVDGKRHLSFSLRNDEIVTQARLQLLYGWSPALIPELSHLKVSLNDELMGTFPLTRENNSGQVGTVQLDPGMFVDFNKLTLGLVAHYTRECEDPVHSTLWANVSNHSKLDLVVRHIRLPNDLVFLPAPFFDRLDNRKLKLPFIFTVKPDNEQLHAAGVVASWFGGLASYRGTHFPVVLGSLPSSNGVIMVMGNSTPAGLQLPPITGASLAVVTNPLNENAKLLVVMGRNARELELAARALSLGKATLTGSQVSVKGLEEIPARKPYDAPNWMPTDRAVHFSELVKDQALQADGLGADSIKVDFSIPPDLFYWKSDGVPVRLNYRYTMRSQQDRSSLNVNANEIFVESLPLEGMPDKRDGKIRLPLLKEGKAVGSEEVLIPTATLFGKNQLQFQYFFDYTKQGACKDVYLNNERGVIDQDSNIDFSSFPHFTAMPNLGFFVNNGFPYTRMADLSETAVVMPDQPSSGEIEIYLDVMGFMGKVTGYPAISHAVISSANVESHADKDLILIGTGITQPLIARWAADMHPLLKNGLHNLELPGAFDRLKSRWDNHDLEGAMRRAGDLATQGTGGLAALVAFESPLKSGRSVVAFTGDTEVQISELSAAMTDAKTIAHFYGDLVMQSGNRIESFQMGPTYYTGKLPWLTALRWHLSNQPLVLALLIAVISLMFAVMAYRYLRRRSKERLGE